MCFWSVHILWLKNLVKTMVLATITNLRPLRLAIVETQIRRLQATEGQIKNLAPAVFLLCFSGGAFGSLWEPIPSNHRITGS